MGKAGEQWGRVGCSGWPKPHWLFRAWRAPRGLCLGLLHGDARFGRVKKRSSGSLASGRALAAEPGPTVTPLLDWPEANQTAPIKMSLTGIVLEAFTVCTGKLAEAGCGASVASQRSSAPAVGAIGWPAEGAGPFLTGAEGGPGRGGQVALQHRVVGEERVQFHLRVEAGGQAEREE